MERVVLHLRLILRARRSTAVSLYVENLEAVGDIIGTCCLVILVQFASKLE
jgi:hypothetical protein